jgi:hypothetical protein
VALPALAPDLVPLLEQAYFNSTPWGGWDYDSPGHDAMRAAAATYGREPNNGYTAGWVFQYNIKALLEKAIENGDLTRDGGGLLTAMGQLDAVDYQGMLPTRSFVGSADETAERGTIINRIDASGAASDFTVPATPFFVGEVASAYDFSAPCFAG